MPQDQAALLAELRSDIERLRRAARANHRAAYALFALALLTSALATVTSALSPSAPVRAAMTALPGLLILANNALKLQQKNRYFVTKGRALERLERSLRYENASVREVSHEYSRLSELFENDWPLFDTLPAAGPALERPTSPRAAAVGTAADGDQG